MQNDDKYYLSVSAVRFIKNHEGYRGEAYKCPAGVWTIGYGHTATAKPGMKITQEQGEQLLRNDLKRFETAVRNHLAGIDLPSNEAFAALVSFTFNVGINAFARSTLLRVVRANPRDFKSIRAQFNRWIYGGGKTLPGLVKRRSQEATAYCESRWP